MKISMICTTLNEEKNTGKFVDSIINQTKKPDEFIIIDGGSKDKTFEILKGYERKIPWIKVYQIKGSNISQGRNFAIKKSVGDVIFTSDCSTIFEKEWIEKILVGFSSGADVVLGKYFVKPKSLLDMYLISRLPNWNKIRLDKFLPSNRHVAYKRVVWEKVGGYPENFKRADDNWFHSKAHKLGFKYYLAEKASVQWLLERNLRNMLRLSFLDSKTEGFSGLFLKRRIYFAEIFVLILLILSVILGIIINIKIFYLFLVLFFLIFLYEGFFKTLIKIKRIDAAFLGIFLGILLYFAHVSGLILGIIQRIYRKKE